jgi:hypothetical protein
MMGKDIPIMFRWETPWRPTEIEKLQSNLGLRPGRTRDINNVMGFILGQALKTYRADPDRWISYSRNQDWYRDPGRQQYFPVRTPYASMKAAVDQLGGCGALEHRKMPPGNLGQQSHFRATKDLYRAYTERPVLLICAPRERIILRDAGGELAAYHNSDRIEKWRRQVLAFNEALSTARIKLDGKLIGEGDQVWIRDEEADDTVIRDDDTDDRRMVNGSATLSLHRIWNGNWCRNGRLYGCWVQNLPKDTRRGLLLNGNPVAEPDYSALHCRLIYDLAGKPMPPGDPFEVDGFERNEVKIAFYTMVNAPSWDSARRVIWKRCPRWNELMPAIADKHSAITKALCSGIGAKLMFMDATIMCRNLADLNREGIIGLPIHDSVIIEAKYESKTREIMERNLALKSAAMEPQSVTSFVTSQVADKSRPKSPPHLLPHLHNGHSGPVGGSQEVPCWVVLLPADLAALAVAAWYSSSETGSVVLPAGNLGKNLPKSVRQFRTNQRRCL